MYGDAFAGYMRRRKMKIGDMTPKDMQRLIDEDQARREAEIEVEPLIGRIERAAEYEKKNPTLKEFPTWTLHLPDFIRALTNRMKTGHLEYGHKSWSKDPLSLLEEIEQETLDRAGWSIIEWARIRQLKSAIRTTIGGLHNELGEVLGRYTEERSSGEQRSEPQVRSSDSGQEAEVEVDGIQRNTTRD